MLARCWAKIGLGKTQPKNDEFEAARFRVLDRRRSTLFSLKIIFIFCSSNGHPTGNP